MCTKRLEELRQQQKEVFNLANELKSQEADNITMNIKGETVKLSHDTVQFILLALNQQLTDINTELERM